MSGRSVKAWVTGRLVAVKQRYPALWRGVERLNSLWVRVVHGKALSASLADALARHKMEGVEFKSITSDDIPSLSELLLRQPPSRVEYFRPHSFGVESLERVRRGGAVLMLGAFRDDALIGYFFLRCFGNKRSFVGRLLDQSVDGLGIGGVMSRILYDTAWGAGFRCFTTVSRDNSMVMRSHSRNPFAHFVGNLPNNFMLVEFRPEGGGGLSSSGYH